MNPELSAKPLGFIMLRPNERAEFDALSERQRGFFLHWVKSNGKRLGIVDRWWRGDGMNWWKTGMRKAREQRP
jgi:hypothetical protein